MRTSIFPTHLRGPVFLAGTASVEQLQKALINLAQSTARPQISVQVTGVVDDQTMVGLSNGLGLITQELPNWLYLILQGAITVGVTSATAKKAVEQYAPQLTIAANTAAVKLKAPVTAPTSPVPMPSGGIFDTLFPPGWYTKPSWGWLIVGAGAYGAYKLLFAKK